MEQQTTQTQNAMAIAAFTCSILSLVSMCTIIGSIFFGCLGITFALLSRGGADKMNSFTKVSLAFSASAIAISLIILVWGTILMGSMFGWETLMDSEALMEKSTEFLQNYYGGNTL